MYFSNVDEEMPHMVFIGRWCPFHKGHEYIINVKRKERPGYPILILVRRTSYDEFSARDRAELVRQWMIKNMILGSVLIIPDTEGVYYGREVGYNVDAIQIPENVRTISATDIRARINRNDESWETIVADGTQEYMKKMLTDRK